MFINTGTQSGVGASQQSAGAGPHMRGTHGGDRTGSLPASFELAYSTVSDEAEGPADAATDDGSVCTSGFCGIDGGQTNELPSIDPPADRDVTNELPRASAPLEDGGKTNYMPPPPALPGDVTNDLPRASEPFPLSLEGVTNYLPAGMANAADLLVAKLWPQSR